MYSTIISDVKNYPLVSKFLRAVLSIFHSTATVEGAINTTRNILNERSHRLNDKTLNARKIVKTAVSSANSKCCYDYDTSDNIYIRNWRQSRGEYVKFNNNNSQPAPEEDSDSDVNTPGDSLSSVVGKLLFSDILLTSYHRS